MGTNYDWTIPGKADDPHIGKMEMRAGAEHPGALRQWFVWDADPVQTIYLLSVLGDDRQARVVRDEYGGTYTARGFLGHLTGMVHHDYSVIGQGGS